MSGKYGSSSFKVLLVDGFSLLAAKVQGINEKVEALQKRSDGVGDEWEESTPTGMRKGSLAQSGGFFDDSANNIHQAWKPAFQTTGGAVYSPPSRIGCAGAAGNVIGRLFWGFAGLFGVSYEVLDKVNELTNANAAYVVTGKVEEGLIVQEWATRTDDWDTAVEGNVVNSGASSAAGGAGYLQVSDFAGPNSLVCKIRHSDTGGVGTFSDLVTFVAVSGAQQAQRVAVAGSVKQYLAFSATGFGHVSASASVSASRSPSVSTSASASPSLSPSASISPSASVSLSPSASISPSASTSLSPSSSRSPSVSTSASASPSLSPSASTSPSASVSPSAGAGPASSVKLFAGFARF